MKVIAVSLIVMAPMTSEGRVRPMLLYEALRERLQFTQSSSCSALITATTCQYGAWQLHTPCHM